MNKARAMGEEVAAMFNPKGLVPFPFENIVEDKQDLRIVYLDSIPGKVSGLIGFSQEQEKFSIIIDSTKPEKRQYFTIAHELGHYFLHAARIRESEHKILIDSEDCLDIDGMLFREDDVLSTVMEREANNFAGALLMPEARVRDVWSRLRNVDRCASVFGVSIIAMSVRLQVLGISEGS